MPKRSKEVYLNDILNCAEQLIALKEEAATIEQFLKTPIYYFAAERLFQILGEAVYKLNELDRKIPISDKVEIIKLRHLLVHDYDIIDRGRLWLFINLYLNPLVEEVMNLINTNTNNSNT